MLQYISITDFCTHRGVVCERIDLSYQVAGPSLGTAPIVLVCHALTGNSAVAEEGWWGSLIGQGKTIDTRQYSILAFDIPGNAYDGREVEDAEALDATDVARLFLRGLEALGINELHSLIGASLGGGIAWTMACLAPGLAKQLIPVATDYRSSDWLLAQTLVQERILAHSSQALEDARIHAMLCYRSPESLNARFGTQQSRQVGKYDVLSWLEYHGDALAKRFKLSAYRVMTYLTKTIKASDTVEPLALIHSDIHIVSITSDLLFPHSRAVVLYEELSRYKANITLEVIDSTHGHDAFLIEYPQLCTRLAPYF